MIHLEEITNGFNVYFNKHKILTHTKLTPIIYIGIGHDSMDMYRGNFKIEDFIEERIPLKNFIISENHYQEYEISFLIENNVDLTMYLKVVKGRFKLEFKLSDEIYNRFWIRLSADENEKIYGCGEQMSYFNLRGRNYPLWTSEPGVGRDKKTYVTWQAEVKDKAGGDYYTTNYPQSTFISTHKYYCHINSTAYMDFNFKNDAFHELQCWEVPKELIFEFSDNYINLLSKLTGYFGRVQPLPEWVYNGIILGIQDGTDVVLNKCQIALDHGVKVAGIWAQDWQGERITAFGKRLNWNWQWDRKLYPGLDQKITELRQQNIRFLGYINPYLIKGYPLYDECLSHGYFAKTLDDGEYLVDFGEFFCGVVDLTNPEAFEWYKNRVIKKELIDFGLAGWMADFGEYLPIDCKLHNGVSAKIMHNDWPRLWAKVNFEAVQESDKLGEILYFMRAGFNGCQPYNLLLWAGDQCVDFSLHDGLASVIPAALSAGMSGSGIHHSDIGGYTTVHGLKRTKELFMRWVEMAAFTPVMRTHEGNRPKDNFQFDQDSEVLTHLAKMVSIYVALKPYIQKIVLECSNLGTPVQRPLFMHYEQDPISYEIQTQYLFGADILVVPVSQEGVVCWRVYLPEDNWVHLFTGTRHQAGWLEIETPLGCPAVFYREKSEFNTLFASISKSY